MVLHFPLESAVIYGITVHHGEVEGTLTGQSLKNFQSRNQNSVDAVKLIKNISINFNKYYEVLKHYILRLC